MSEENKVELKDEDLEKVNGGGMVIPPDCAYFIVKPKYDMSEVAKENNSIFKYSCNHCTYWEEPEGPCTLGH